MGREIRRVPAKWEHPKDGEFIPLQNITYEKAAEEWKKEYAEFYAKVYSKETGEYWEYAVPPPNRDEYVSYEGRPCTWYQVYETVTEGTPVTPPFATQEELVDYLVAYGDFWDQDLRMKGVKDMRCDPWEREAARKFVFEEKWAPTFVSGPGIPLEQGHRINKKGEHA